MQVIFAYFKQEWIYEKYVVFSKTPCSSCPSRYINPVFFTVLHIAAPTLPVQDTYSPIITTSNLIEFPMMFALPILNLEYFKKSKFCLQVCISSRHNYLNHFDVSILLSRFNFRISCKPCLIRK